MHGSADRTAHVGITGAKLGGEPYDADIHPVVAELLVGLGGCGQTHPHRPGIVQHCGLVTLLDKLQPVIALHANAVTRRVSQRTLLAIAAAARDPDTPADVAAELNGFLAGVGRGFARASGETGDALWQRSMARTLADPALLASELDKVKRPRPAIPAGMPIGGDTGWFDDVAQNLVQ